MIRKSYVLYTHLPLVSCSWVRVKYLQTWKLLGRQVRKGERGIRIITPRFRAQEDEETGEKCQVLTGFGSGSVFDISQTDGKDLPAPPVSTILQSESDLGKAVFR